MRKTQRQSLSPESADHSALQAPTTQDRSLDTAGRQDTASSQDSQSLNGTLPVVGIHDLSTGGSYGPAGLKRSEATRATWTAFARTPAVYCHTVPEGGEIQCAPLL